MSDYLSRQWSGQWQEQWSQAQRAYLEAWKSMMRFSPGKPGITMPADLWTQALETWWKTISGGMAGGFGGAPGGDGRAVFARMVEQGMSFFNLGQQLGDLYRSVGDAAGSGEKWKEILLSRFDAMKSSLAMNQSNEWAESMKGLNAFFAMPLDTWRRTLSGVTMMPGDFLQHVREHVLEGMGEKLHADVDKFLSVPGVGYTREGQEQTQEMARLFLDYQKAMQEYMDAHAKVSAQSLDCMYKKIITLTEQGQSITSLRQMYDLWVDSSEEVYGKFVMSTGFREVYARMVNALMRLKLHARTMVDEFLGAFNMPTRSEMNTVLKRQQELRRQFRTLQRALGEATPPPRGGRKPSEEHREELNGLHNEVQTLRQQVAALEVALASAPAASVAPAPALTVVSPRKPRRTPVLRAVKSSEPPPASPQRPKARAAKPASSWDIGAIITDNAAAPNQSTTRRGSKR